MEVKKNPKVDLKNWQGVFLEVGLVVALVICIVAFSIGQKEKNIEKLDLGGVAEETEMIDVTQQAEPEPPAEIQKQTVQVLADVFEVVKNDTQVESDFTFFEMDDVIDLGDIDLGQEEIEEEEIFIIAEEMPSFQGGGLEVFRDWVNKNFRYPQVAIDNGIQGTVYVFFVVEKDGSVTNVKVLRSPDPILSDEAVRLITQSPRWTAGKNRNQPVRIQFTLPITLTIN